MQAAQFIATLALLAFVRVTSVLSFANSNTPNKEVTNLTKKVRLAGLMASAVIETVWAIGVSGAATVLSASAQCPETHS